VKVSVKKATRGTEATDGQDSSESDGIDVFRVAFALRMQFLQGAVKKSMILGS
jgi:hypothetical protein